MGHNILRIPILNGYSSVSAFSIYKLWPQMSAHRSLLNIDLFCQYVAVWRHYSKHNMKRFQHVSISFRSSSGSSDIPY